MAAQKDYYELLHYNMIHAHNTFKLGYETIISLLGNPPEQDIGNFLGYCEAWALSIVHHHDTEEATVFPLLSKKMDFSVEQEQHRAVHSFLEQFLAMIGEVQADYTKFNSEAMKDLMGKSKDALFTHFDEEVVHIEAEKLRDAQITEGEIKDLIIAMGAYVRSHGDSFLILPFMRSHTPPELKDVWPPLPWVLRKLVVPYILAMRHYGYWKYAPYGMS
ncbi:hypothetical protein M0805_005139 [Coniferiporia weirii]|nr:hypothetical protein M0805_005139 [Coniferiporia weirii]